MATTSHVRDYDTHTYIKMVEDQPLHTLCINDRNASGYGYGYDDSVQNWHHLVILRYQDRRPTVTHIPYNCCAGIIVFSQLPLSSETLSLD